MSACSAAPQRRLGVLRAQLAQAAPASSEIIVGAKTIVLTGANRGLG
jgi:hypothetical protein